MCKQLKKGKKIKYDFKQNIRYEFHKILMQYNNYVNTLSPSDNYIVTKCDFKFILILYYFMHAYAHIEIHCNFGSVWGWVGLKKPTKVSH